MLQFDLSTIRFLSSLILYPIRSQWFVFIPLSSGRWRRRRIFVNSRLLGIDPFEGSNAPRRNKTGKTRRTQHFFLQLHTLVLKRNETKLFRSPKLKPSASTLLVSIGNSRTSRDAPFPPFKKVLPRMSVVTEFASHSEGSGYARG